MSDQVFFGTLKKVWGIETKCQVETQFKIFEKRQYKPKAAIQENLGLLFFLA